MSTKLSMDEQKLLNMVNQSLIPEKAIEIIIKAAYETEYSMQKETKRRGKHEQAG